MLDTLKQPTISQFETTLPPSTTYDQASKTIHVTVIVSKSDSGLLLAAPVIGVPGSGSPRDPATWTVIWTVVAGSGLDSVAFTAEGADKGIRIPADSKSFVPAAVNRPIRTEPVPGHPDQWQATITHRVESANSINYTMFVRGERDGIITPGSHDPTIVVTLDPMGG